MTQTIQKLNREARKRFAETFEGAAKNFEQLFPKLLRGGKGRLELTAADDVLDAGVNILVQPLGKKVKEIGLLSGGEKALSAMALIFSLFLLNPSPFCVMDEVDAPLDEFSLAAFTGLVQRTQAKLAVHHHHAQPAHHAERGQYPWRDDGSAGHLAHHLAQDSTGRVGHSARAAAFREG